MVCGQGRNAVIVRTGLRICGERVNSDEVSCPKTDKFLAFYAYLW